MKVNHTMSISKISTNLSSIRQNAKLKNNFENLVYNFLVVKGF